MKKIVKEYPVTRSRDDSATTGFHIYLVRIFAFASGVINFTEKENAHFDLCRVCRLKMIHALRKVTAPERSTALQSRQTNRETRSIAA